MGECGRAWEGLRRNEKKIKNTGIGGGAGNDDEQKTRDKRFVIVLRRALLCGLKMCTVGENRGN